MPPDTRKYLFDMQQAVLGIEMFVAAKTFDQFMSDLMLRLAVERQFEILGEALSQLSKIDPALAVQIPEHPQIISFRNLLIHNYGKIDHSIMWKIIQERLPILRQQLQSMLGA